MRKLLVLVIILFSTAEVFAQYKAPILTCVSRKSIGSAFNEILWKDPNETCGAFQSFSIYFATNKSGPYSLLTSISNLGTTNYSHTGINSSNTYYYYMTSSYSCPGVSSSSDTLSDTLMPFPPLLAITIENNFPVYKWTPILNQKKIWGYVLINFGSNYVDTVIGRESTEYIDSSFQANTGVYTGHMVGSLSACGERGLSPPIFRHRPMFLSLISNPCEDEIEFAWTKYQGWGPNDDVKGFEIYIKKNSDTERLITAADSSVRTFRYKEFQYGDTLCIRIKAYHPTNPDIFSFSNQICFVSTKSQIPNLLQVLSASYLDNYKTLVKWYCSVDAIPKSFDLIIVDPRNGGQLRALDKVKYKSLGNGYYSFLDSFGESTRAIAYNVRYEDLCNNKSDGIQALTNFISVNQIGLYKNEIKWPKKYFHDSILYSKLKYELFFSHNGNDFNKVAEPDVNSSSFEHNVDEHYLTEGKFCYKLNLIYKFDTTKFIRDSVFTISSQTQCIDMRTVLWMPNAFKVNGVTPVFKPKMYFFKSGVFNMKIFNRWGQQIFETVDPYQGWNGLMNNGQQASEDSYVYLITYIGNDGVLVEKTGTFTLIK